MISILKSGDTFDVVVPNVPWKAKFKVIESARGFYLHFANRGKRLDYLLKISDEFTIADCDQHGFHPCSTMKLLFFLLGLSQCPFCNEGEERLNAQA
jgi:hypothetical protein